MSDRVVAAFVPLVDCAVLVAAREQGFAAAEGLDLKLVREPSWASLRDHLSLGQVDCAHALAPLPVALTLGVGHVRVDCVVPFVLGRGGNAVTLSARLVEEMRSVAENALAGPKESGATLAPIVRRRREPLTLGMVFPFSNHNFDLRYWLAAAGVHPDRDVRLVAIPPPLMVDSLRLGLVDGFCVGEPWNSLAVREGLGVIVTTQSQLVPRAAEKVLAMRADFARRSELLAPLLRALDAAAAWCDDPAHHGALAAQLARPDYVGVPEGMIADALAGRPRLGGGATLFDPNFLYFHRGVASLPSAADGLWGYAQMVRWGQVAATAAAERSAAGVFRADLFRSCLGETAAEPRAPLPFDGLAFDVDDVASYLARFELRTPFAEFRPL